MGKPQVAGVYEKILECAKKEFLEKGFEGASLRVIAQEAGTSTNSIYVRFKDKVGVFEALVQPAADGLKEIIQSRQNAFGSMSPREQSEQVMEYSDPALSGYSCLHLRSLCGISASGQLLIWDTLRQLHP